MAYYKGSTYDLQSRKAQLSNSTGTLDQPLPILLSQDALNPGTQNLTLPNRYLAPKRSTEYTYLETLFAPLIGADSVNPGIQLLVLPPSGRARSRDYSYTLTNFSGLFGNLGPNPGIQIYDLPPRGTARSRDYSYSLPLFPSLIGADALTVGKQLLDLSLRGNPRSKDYTYLLPLNLDILGKDSINPGVVFTDLFPRSRARSNDYSFITTLFGDLIGTDAVNPGAQFYDLAPKSPIRAKDYSFTNTLFSALIGADATNPGIQTYTNPILARLRGIRLPELPVNITIALDASLTAPVPNGLSTYLTELPPRGVRRSKDYSYTYTVFIPLIGADSLVSGVQISGNATLTKPRLYTLYDPSLNQIPLLTTVDSTVGDQLLDLPTRAIRRLLANGLVYSFPLELIGADLFPNGIGGQVQKDWPNPVLGRRLRDYTQIQTLPLFIYQQLPIGQSLDLTARAPIGYKRSNSYTHLQALRIELIGQDTLFGAPGEVPVFDWPNPRGYRRGSSLYILDPNDILGLESAPQRDIDFNIGQPYLAWSMGQPYLVWAVGAPKQ